MPVKRLGSVGLLLAPLLTMVACSTSDGSARIGLSQGPVHWEGGTAACTVEHATVAVGCAIGHRIQGDPYRCPNFNAGQGSADACQAICGTVSGCSIAGLSDGSNAVLCLSHCSNNAH